VRTVRAVGSISAQFRPLRAGKRLETVRLSQRLTATAVRSAECRDRWTKLKSSSTTLLHFARMMQAKKKRDLLLRASPLRFRALEKSRRIGAVVFGPEGVGKSSTINTLLGRNVCKVKDSLLASMQVNPAGEPPVTAVEYEEGTDFRVYETFGMGDTIAASVVANELRDPLEHPLTSFVFVDRFDNHRVPKDTIFAATSVLGASLWKRCMIVLTHGDLVETYKKKMTEDVDLIDLKRKLYNQTLNDIIEECNQKDGTKMEAVEVPVFVLDNTLTRENREAVENIATLMDLLKKHAGSRSYLFSFQGIGPQGHSHFSNQVPITHATNLLRRTHPNLSGSVPSSPRHGFSKEPSFDNESQPFNLGDGPRRSNSFVGAPPQPDLRDKGRMRVPKSRRRRSNYDVLGIPDTATNSDIRRAYKDLARKFHPDRNPENVAGALAMFREITEAYEKLVDDKAESMSIGEDGTRSQTGDAEMSTSTTGFPVYIRTQHRRYWTIREGQELRSLCKEHELGALERFEIRWVMQGGFIIRGHGGKVVTLSEEGDRLLLQSSDEAFRSYSKEKGKIPPYMFKILFLDDGKFIISAANHKFIAAERGGYLRANRDTARAWETFGWRLAPSDSGEELQQNPLVVNFCGHTKRYIDVNPHEVNVTCTASHPATAERFCLEPVHGRLFRLRGSDGRLLCVAHDSTLIMADEEDDDFQRIIRRSEFLADFSDFGRVVLSVVDIRDKLFVSVEKNNIELRNRRRRNAELVLRICFEDTQMMRQLEFFSDEHLPWMGKGDGKEAMKAKMPAAKPVEVMPTRFSMYRHF